MSDPLERSVEVRVHERDDPRIERILDLIDEAARPRPPVEVLGVLCAEVAAIVEAQVASLYVRDEDEDDVLVMRANVGFRGGAVGTVRLSVGEGITGFAAECMRPVTVTAAATDEHFKPVPGLGEEDFPIFLALPILVGRRAEAVLVLQRRGGRPFGDEEVVLSTALSTSFAYALERARAREEREEEQVARKAQLTGSALAPGAALGRVETLPTFSGLAALARARGLAEPLAPEVGAIRVTSAFEQVAKELARAAAPLEAQLDPRSLALLQSLFLLWDDQQLRERLDEEIAADPNPASALAALARAYARAPYEVGADRSSTDRSVELEHFCLAVAARLVDLRVPTQGSALLLTDRLPALVALLAVSHRASALAVSGALEPDALGVAIARAAGLPLVDRVGGLFAWAHVGDRVLIDADEGLVQVNPGPAAVARYRSQR